MEAPFTTGFCMLRTLFIFLFACSLRGAPAQQLCAAEHPLEEYLEEESPSFNQVSDVRSLFFKTFGLLAALCSLIIVGGYVLRRISGAKVGVLGTGGAIDLVERKYISPKTALWLVTINGQPFVVVDGQNGVAIKAIQPPRQP